MPLDVAHRRLRARPRCTRPKSCSRSRARRSTSTSGCASPYGLVRTGVAPDHRRTRRVSQPARPDPRATRGSRCASACEIGARPHPRAAARAPPRGDLRRRRERRPSPRGPRRGAARRRLGHGVRRLVQRPPGPRRPRVRPVAPPRRGDRQRQRRARRRPHAHVDPETLAGTEIAPHALGRAARERASRRS